MRAETVFAGGTRVFTYIHQTHHQNFGTPRPDMGELLEQTHHGPPFRTMQIGFQARAREALSMGRRSGRGRLGSRCFPQKRLA